MNKVPITAAGEGNPMPLTLDPGIAGYDFSADLASFSPPTPITQRPELASTGSPLAYVPSEPPLACYSPYSAPLGQIDYSVVEGDTLDSIASRHGLSPNDILLTAPQFAARDPLPGDRFPVLYDAANPAIAAERRTLAQDMATATDPDHLNGLVSRDLDLATSRAAVPGDIAGTLQEELIARRPGDDAFADVVQQQIYQKTQTWEAEGRTQDVFYPLFQAAETGDQATFQTVLEHQYQAIGSAAPTPEAIERHRDLLLTYGPSERRFQQWVDGETTAFLVERPHQAALDVDTAFQTGGAAAGAAKLRELTDPGTVDPLTAGETFRRSEGTVRSISQSFRDLSNSNLSQIYSDISASADSASRSDVAFPAIGAIAGDLPVDAVLPYVRESVENGDGVVLPLALTRMLYDSSGDEQTLDRLTHEIHVGVTNLRQRAVDAAVDLNDTALPLLEPLTNWEESLGGIPDELKREWIKANPELIEQIGGKLDKAGALGYQIVRAGNALEHYRRELPGLEVGDANFLDELSGWESDQRLALIAGSSPQAMLESFREGNLDMLEGKALKPASFYVPDASWPTRMVRNHVISYINPRPWTAPLSAFGVATYLWGVVSHSQKLANTVDTYGWERGVISENGWRNIGFLGMYGVGAAIEGNQALTLATTGEKVWLDAFKSHVRAFGWYNLAGTVNYLARGDNRRALALGTATAGTLLGGYATELNAAKWLGRTAGPIASGLVMVGSASLAGVDAWDQHEAAIRTEPYNERFLALSGLDPALAALLAVNDSDGRGLGPKLEQVADHIHATPEELFQWVVQHDPDWVRRFADAVGGIRINQAGLLADQELLREQGYAGAHGAQVPPRSLPGLLRSYPELGEWAERNQKAGQPQY